MNRSALVWFAVGAGVAGAISTLSTYVLSKRVGTDLVMVVYEPPNAEDKDWDSMSKEEVADNNLIAAGAVRECGVTKFNSSTVLDGLNFTEFALDLHSTRELNCVFRKSHEEHLPLMIRDRNENPETDIVSATATIPDLDTAREDGQELNGK